MSGALYTPSVTYPDEGWSFVHGPGTDDPLIGYHRQVGSERILYFVTDGEGRVLAVADSAGYRSPADNNTTGIPHWRLAGGSVGGNSFKADRMSGGDVPGLSFYRNRAYDQTTGRWTQEDPIGIAGGLNLYQFNGNNPVAHTDPFGLCTKKDRGNCTQADVGSSDIGPRGQSILGQVFGAVRDFLRNRDALANTPGKNRTSVTDKFHHCMANCEAARRGPAGEAAAEVLSDVREGVQIQMGGPGHTPEDSSADQEANSEGRAVPATGQTCTNYCQTRFPPTK